MKKILPLLLFTLINVQAQTLDAIAIDVEGEPITTLEIQAVQQKMNISKQAAVEALIKDRLEIATLKKANIVIDSSMIEARVQAIARSKGMTQEKMKSILLQKGLTWESYIEQLSNKMKKERFYQEYIASSVTPPSDADLKMYYNAHRAEFNSASSQQISLIAFSSQSEALLQRALANPLSTIQGVNRKNILASTSEMTPQLKSMIDQTPRGEHTQIVNTGRGFISYLVKSKGSQSQGGFQSVKQAVLQKWIMEHRVQAGQDFFNKLKSSANIRVIRL